MKRRKHRNDYNHGKNGYVAGNPRTKDTRSKAKQTLQRQIREHNNAKK